MIRGKLNRYQLIDLSEFLSKQIRRQCFEVTRAIMYCNLKGKINFLNEYLAQNILHMDHFDLKHLLQHPGVV